MDRVRTHTYFVSQIKRCCETSWLTFGSLVLHSVSYRSASIFIRLIVLGIPLNPHDLLPHRRHPLHGLRWFHPEHEYSSGPPRMVQASEYLPPGQWLVSVWHSWLNFLEPRRPDSSAAHLAGLGI